MIAALLDQGSALALSIQAKASPALPDPGLVGIFKPGRMLLTMTSKCYTGAPLLSPLIPNTSIISTCR